MHYRSCFHPADIIPHGLTVISNSRHAFTKRDVPVRPPTTLHFALILILSLKRLEGNESDRTLRETVMSRRQEQQTQLRQLSL